MTKNVLTGVDDSSTALEAARAAAELAQAFRGRLFVISAYGPTEKTVLSDGIDRVVVDSRAEAERSAGTVVKVLQREYPDLDIVAGSAEGIPSEALVREADRLEADVIVIGNKRVQGPTRILGSIVRSVAAVTSKDVYVVNTHSGTRA